LPRHPPPHTSKRCRRAAIDAFVAAGAKGIVVAGSGRGATTGGERQAIDRALSKGVIVVVGTRTGSGTVPVGEGVRGANGAASTIGTGDLNPQKARVLLMLALTRTTDRREVAKIFQANQ